MTREKSLLAVVALSGALGLSATPLWSQNVPAMPQQKGDTESQQLPAERDRQQPAERHQQTDMNQKSSAADQAGLQEVKKIQETLKEKGHDPGPIDGVLGPQTREALKSFQMASGIEASGKIDAQTAAKLGVEKSSSSRNSMTEKSSVTGQ